MAGPFSISQTSQLLAFKLRMFIWDFFPPFDWIQQHHINQVSQPNNKFNVFNFNHQKQKQWVSQHLLKLLALLNKANQCTLIKRKQKNVVCINVTILNHSIRHVQLQEKLSLSHNSAACRSSFSSSILCASVSISYC